MRGGWSIGLRAADAAPLDVTVPYRYYQSEVFRLLEVVALVGADGPPEYPLLATSAREQEAAGQLLPGDRPWVALHAGASDPRRRWAPERFAAAADRLAPAVQGLSYLHDQRLAELEPFERWPGRPEPELIEPGRAAWQRWTLHNAANPAHLARRHLRPEERWLAYKIAWVGGCVLYDRGVLDAVGGFDFWPELPPAHCGEDVLVQHRVLARAGGAGILPSGAVHLESPTTVPDRTVQARTVIGLDPAAR